MEALTFVKNYWWAILLTWSALSVVILSFFAVGDQDEYDLQDEFEVQNDYGLQDKFEL